MSSGNNVFAVDVKSTREYRLESDARLRFMLAKEKLQEISSWGSSSQSGSSLNFHLAEPNGKVMDALPAEGDLVAMGARDPAMGVSKSWFIIDKIAESRNNHLDEYQFIMRSTAPPDAPRNLTNQSAPFSIVLRRAGEQLSVEIHVSDPLKLDYPSGERAVDPIEQLKTSLQSIADDLVKS